MRQEIIETVAYVRDFDLDCKEGLGIWPLEHTSDMCVSVRDDLQYKVSDR